MPANISEVTINGQNIVEAMYANSPAWHSLGTIFDPGGHTAPDSDTAIELSHLGWHVNKRLFELDGQQVPDCYALQREDTGKVLSMVGPQYTTWQNRDMFKFVDSLLMDDIMRYESAFALKEGQRVCILARMPSIDWVAEGDGVLRYLMASMSHGGGSIRLCPTRVRVVCANTEAMAWSSAEFRLKIRHSGDIEAKLEDVREYLNELDIAFTKRNSVAQQLAEKQYTNDQAKEYINKLFPEPASTASKRKVNGRERRVQAVRDAFRSPAQNLESIRGSWWALYNAVTETVDHGKFGREAKDPLARSENRFIRVTEGEGAKFKEQAFDLAVQMAA